MGQRNEEIDREAAVWAAKVAGGTLTSGEQAQLDAWRAADIRHVGAFARAQAVLLRLDRLCVVGPDTLRQVVAEAAEAEGIGAAPSSFAVPPSDANPRQAWTRRRVMLTGGAAASLAAAGLLVTAFSKAQRQSAGAPTTEYFVTRRGQTRTVRLADGSVVTLDTDTKLAVTYTDKVRALRLEHGEALFQVAKNKQRPFIVTAANTKVKAVGTSFTVRNLPARPIRVLVREGVVEVARVGGRQSERIRAAAETQTLVSPDAPMVVETVPPQRVERKLAWQYGRIAFENETLADAAEEFARYSDTKIEVDPAVSGRTITGVYAANDPVGFARVVASVLNLHVSVADNEVWIVR